MPPVNPASRTSLVSWTVATSIIAVVAVIFAAYQYVERDRIADLNENKEKQYADVARPSDLNTPDVQALKEARNATDGPIALERGDPALLVALKQRNALAQKITGNAAAAPASAVTSAQNALQEAQEKVQVAQVQINNSNLVGAVQSLSDAVVSRQAEIDSLKRQLAEVTDNATKAISASKDQMAKLKNLADQARQAGEQEKRSAQDDRRSKDDQIQQLQDDFSQQQLLAQEQATQSQVQLDDLRRQLREADREKETLQARLEGLRIDPTRATVQQVDGRILRLPGNNLVFIDLGQGEQVTPGLTFQVYDKYEGVPNLGAIDDADARDARGKAEIEVIRVGPNSAEARIIRQAPGTVLSEGDLLVNVVFDRNTRYNFFVQGNFDLNHDGNSTPGDAEVIRRLITQWGGNVTDQVNVDTDFVVLGAEPTLPDASREDLEANPILRARYDQAVRLSEQYQEWVAKARSYRIPILNQNRFLYMVGYYDQAKR